jgi:tetratricopeptide (TPR) repeat protein
MEVQSVVSGLGSAAIVRAELGQHDVAAELLTEVVSSTGAMHDLNYAILLAAMVRAALRIAQPALAERLAHGLVPRYPYFDHALVAANAALTEHAGELRSAADAYADAAGRWERFGVVPEQAFALLGQGRCLVGLSRLAEAVPVLQQARTIFEPLEAAPALDEIDELLGRATPGS